MRLPCLMRLPPGSRRSWRMFRLTGAPCYTFVMAARRFIMLVLTIFALQLSWTAVAAYCEHESGRAAQHFGHHSSDSDTHQASTDTNDSPTGAVKKAAVHSHCSSCSHATLALDGLPTVVAVALADRGTPPSVSPPYSSSFPARPERPQWISAV